MEVKRINHIDTHPIRHQMLRPNSPMSDCEFIGDKEESSFHLGAFIDKKLVSIASFYFESHPDIAHEGQYRLRGMATMKDFQGKGLSQALLKTAFPLIKQNQCTILWCNARTSAEGFYSKVGFKVLGNEFDIPTIGPHKLMYIEIDKTKI